MPARAKFKCYSKSVYEGNVGGVMLSPVTCGSEENKQFFKYTPGGKLELQTVNEEVMKMFEPGKEYYIDITEA